MQNSNSFRVDIQGLRGIAVLLVVLYHLDVHWLSGGYIGVDIFFVISGYLITGHLIESLDSKRFNFVDFYARRVRRIIPASLFVLLCTTVVACFVMPPLLLPKLLKESIATAIYLPNIFYALQQTDYLAETTVSPLLHYWSLGVEEQFYFMWPLLLFVCWRFWGSNKNYVITILSALLLVSFIANVYLTKTSQSWAFFLVFTRAWELGAGGLLAFALKQNLFSNQKIHPFLATACGWCGVVVLAFCAFIYNEHTVFPGSAALLPVVGAVLIIFAGARSERSSLLNKLMANRPLQYMGMVSYSLYLWHWPVIIIAEEIWPEFSGIYAIVSLFIVSVALADITYRCIEEPFRHSGSRLYIGAKPALAASMAGSVFIVLLAGGYGYSIKSQPLFTEQLAAEYQPQVNPEFTSFVPKNLVPNLRKASDSISIIYNDGCHDDMFTEDARGCIYGDKNAETIYVLFGDSHAAQWFPALEKYSRENSIRLVTFTKSACPAIDALILRQGVEYSSCHEWRKKAVEKINQLNPQLVILSNYQGSIERIVAEDRQKEWGEGLARMFKLLPANSQIIVIGDTPGFERTPALCLSKNLVTTLQCQRSKERTVNAGLAALEEKVALAGNKHYVNMNNYLCAGDTCGPIIGNILVYRDQHHITVEFSERLADVLGAAIKQKLNPSLAQHH
ncbi:MAG TPA: acyltransferase family protein [Cellvibrio sp.]|nr:acyltransferase family protein [Cellvibrio sp.]